MKRSCAMLANSVFWKDFPNTRLVTMNREKALNALDVEMINIMKHAYMQEPHAKGSSALYVLKGAGSKSFCSGGDVVSVVKDKSQGTKFFYNEYQLDYHILTMPNPQVSLWNGYVMGGGVGVSIHGKYRVASERATFAMPETAIGLHPDVGGSWFLPRLQKQWVGLYLGLTGARVKGADLVHLGLATHFVPSGAFAKLEERLCNIDDPSRVDACLDEFAVTDLPPLSLDAHRGTLETAFTLQDATTVEGILEALKKDGSDFAQEAVKQMCKASPTCLKITVELMRRAAKMKTMREALALEFNVIQRISSTNEFTRGVTARMIDKTDPKWNPSTVEEVTASYVKHFFDSDGLPAWNPEAE